MEDVVAVAKVEAVEQLLQIALDVLESERPEQRLLHEAGQVVIHVLEHQVDAPVLALLALRPLPRHHDLAQVDDVLVLELLEDLDFADGRDGELAGNGRVSGCPGPTAGRLALRTPSFSLSIRTFFSATIRLVAFSRARYTCP